MAYLSIFGIGRPNIIVSQDFGRDGNPGTFTLHMSIEDLTGEEADGLRVIIEASKTSHDRHALKKELKRLMKVHKVNFKGGHKMVDSLPNDPDEDGEIEP